MQTDIITVMRRRAVACADYVSGLNLDQISAADRTAYAQCGKRQTLYSRFIGSFSSPVGAATPKLVFQ